MTSLSTTTKLTIKNATFYGYHGVKSEEKTLGGKYSLDIEMLYDGRKAVLQDEVQFAVNYQEVMYTVAEILNESFNLVETIAWDIASNILEKFSLVGAVTVKIRKHVVPIGEIIDYIEAEVTLKREGKVE
ncbi:MAG: dihydroneopterin aldolase [Candidatus Kapabacteria bacterium]|nr:dihydroneopterin aldolase [Candidatus Kapabacteria bacterium]